MIYFPQMFDGGSQSATVPASQVAVPACDPTASSTPTASETATATATPTATTAATSTVTQTSTSTITATVTATQTPTSTATATLTPTPIGPPIPAVTLSADLTSGQPVGTTITWTAGANDAASLQYRFTVDAPGQSPTIVRDYTDSNTVSWTPIDEGVYTIEVTVQEFPFAGHAPTTLASPGYAIVSRTTSNQPVVSRTANPLVALYSIPPCGSGTVRALFNAGADPRGGQSTPRAPCSTTQSTNFYIAGMHPSLTYAIESEVTNGTIQDGPIAFFTTGAIPSSVSFPTITVPVPPSGTASFQDGVVFHSDVIPGASMGQIFATDLAGNVIWYYPTVAYWGFIAHPLPGGDVIVLGIDLGGSQVLRVVDLAGNTVRETSMERINEQLAAGPAIPGHSSDQVDSLHHEVSVLPNGHIVVLGTDKRTFPPGTQGSTSGLPVTIQGDEIIDLDQNLQVDWTWNTFDFLDVNRAAVLGEFCCGAVDSWNDWTHSNAIVYAAADRSLLLSIRHQDWIVKIDYADGTGDGHIMWRLGNQGDFTLTNPPAGDAFPWFSHQHGIVVTSDGRLVTFDDGNTRCNQGGPSCHSRGQVYQLDEVNHRATLLVDADMGNVSFALGWAQILQNGDYSFTSGFQTTGSTIFGQAEEFDPTGAMQTHVIQDQNELVYRAYRLPSMYGGCCGE